jgi:uncharacterized phage-associated protein
LVSAEEEKMIRFNLDKTIQAAAYLIKRQPGRRENYTRLLKLLYLADRRSLKERGAPICGDTAYAMERGPVPSRTLDLIGENDPEASKWGQFIETDGYDVRLATDPGNLQLSRAEIKVLEVTAREFAAYDEWDLVRWCHENLPEYEKNWNARGTKQSKRIPLQDVLEAVGRLNDQTQIIADINADAAFSHLFSDHAPAS